MRHQKIKPSTKIADAENDFIGHPFEPDEGLDITMERHAFYAGATWAIAEIIKQSKKWLEENLLTTSQEEIDHMEFNIITEKNKKNFLKDFEKHLNKIFDI